jgi:hypothetical protein
MEATSEWLFVLGLPRRSPEISRFGLLGLWELITPKSNLRLQWGLEQSCSSPQDLFNGVLHSPCTHQDRVDSQLLVVGSPTTIWLPTLLSTITCAIDVQMTHARPFWASTLQDLSNGIKNINAKCFDPCNQALSFRESQRTPSSHFWECEFHPHTCFKVGLRQLHLLSVFPFFNYFLTLFKIVQLEIVYNFCFVVCSWLDFGSPLMTFLERRK